jgi:hypothetical protein
MYIKRHYCERIGLFGATHAKRMVDQRLHVLLGSISAPAECNGKYDQYPSANPMKCVMPLLS